MLYRLILLFALFFLPISIFAASANNKFGIHLAQPHLSDLKKVRDMVNANGGDWGYVTLVIQDDDRNREKWQEIFDLLREYHLIPIVRIATHPEGSKWRRPVKNDAQGWADFLESLHWVVKNRYVVLFNEPNHGSEWGGTVDAYDFAETSKEFAEKLKTKSSDFFIMLGAIDSSAPTSMPNYLGEEYFFENFFQKVTVQDFERLFGGLASHSYPNPAFSGTPWDSGRGTVRSYDWELGLLGRLGVNKKLPVFITETGWKRKVNSYQLTVIKNGLEENTVADYFKIAYEQVWLPDERVVAVTPFVFDYQGEPFLNFSWKMFQTEEFYPQYYTVKSLLKIKGEPEQIDTGEFLVDLPKELVASSNYHFKVKLRNRGQAIWDKRDSYKLEVRSGKLETFEYFSSDIRNIRPFEEADTDLYIKTNDVVGKKSGKVVLTKDNRTVLGIEDWSFEIVPLPSLTFNISLYPKLLTNGEHFEIQIFDEKEELVFKRGGVRVTRGLGKINDVQNIIPGKKYRIVVLNPYYLPRQGFITFQRGENLIRFKRMLPFDFNQNGQLDGGDAGELLKNLRLIKLFLP